MENEENQTVVSSSPKQKRGAKGFTFFSGLFDILIGVVLFATIIWVALDLFPTWTAGNNGLNALWAILIFPFLIAFVAVMVIGGILFIVFGISSVIASFKPDRHFNKGLIVATMVFDILIGILSVLGTLITLDSGGSGVVVIFGIVIALSVVGLIFKIIDLSLISHRNKVYSAEHPVETKTEGDINFEALAELNNKSKEKKK